MSNKVKITTKGQKEHSKKKIVEELDNFIKDYQENNIDEEKLKEVLGSIKCKYVHEGEIFIASDKTVWPCCFLWDSFFRNKDNIKETFADFSDDWNSLKNKSIDEILSHPWFKEILAESWDPRHGKHISRCIRTCAKNKAYHNEFDYKK
jgi:hypothetical protein